MFTRYSEYEKSTPTFHGNTKLDLRFGQNLYTLDGIPLTMESSVALS